MIHGHGDDGYRYRTPLRANFSSNVRLDGPPAALLEHLRERLPAIGSYPEVAAESLVTQLATIEGIPVETVLVTNGAVAGIHLTAQAFRESRSAVVVPTFAEYEDAARLHDHTIEFASDPGEAAARAPDLVWWCNPNNPTGDVKGRTEVLAIVDAFPATRFVLDLAYADSCEAEPVRAADAVVRPNLILIYSLTKSFGLPGLRLGYVVAAAPVLARIAQGAPPWSVNSLALAAGVFCLRHRDALGWPRAAHLAAARALRAELARIDALRVVGAATPFFLMQLSRGTGAALKAYLVHEHGLLVRDAGNFRGLGPEWVRISAQTPEANGWLVEAMLGWQP
jgi:threonine-phosphate decarboxylase